MDDDFASRYRALLYDYPWIMYPYVFGMIFLVFSIVDWGSHLLFGWELHSFLERMAFSAVLAFVAQYKDRRREHRRRA